MQLKDHVKRLQAAMNSSGEKLVVDGIFGPRTAAALDKFDMTIGLTRKPVAAAPKRTDIIPFAIQSPVKMVTRGKYANGWPKGAVVHYTAGGDGNGAALATIKGGIGNGYTYLCIDKNGDLIQAHPVSGWGYHAGESGWPGLNGGLNDETIGIEICNPGILKKGADGLLRTWTGTVVKQEDARYVTLELHGCPTGWYKKYSPEQEATLIKLLRWLKENDPTGKTFKYENVVGHHECSGPRGMPKRPDGKPALFRKQDPGGCLSMSMDALRAKLIKG